jgi:hypothetical protein
MDVEGIFNFALINAPVRIESLFGANRYLSVCVFQPDTFRRHCHRVIWVFAQLSSPRNLFFNLSFNNTAEFY